MENLSRVFQKQTKKKHMKRLNVITQFKIEFLLLFSSCRKVLGKMPFYAWFLNILSNGEGLDCFSQPNILPKLSKITVNWLKPVKINKVGSFLTCPKSAKWLSILNCQSHQNDEFENLYISSHGKARNMKFGQQVNLIQRVQLGTLPQEVLMSLPHTNIFSTNLFIFRATVIKFGL